MRAPQRVLGAIALASTVTLLAACGSSAASAGGGSSKGGGANGTTYKVGVILPLTGPAASIGTEYKSALDVFTKIDPDAKSITIDYVTCDDQSTPTGAATCARKLTQQDRVTMVYGPILSGTFAGAQPVLASGPPTITGSPYVAPPAGSGIFSASGSALDLDTTTLKYAKDKGFTKVGVLAATDATGQTATADVKQANTSLGLDLTFETMGPTDTDVSAQLNRLKQANVQFVYVAASGAAAGVAVKGIKLLGMSSIPTAFIWSNTSNGFLKAAGPAFPTTSLFAMSPSWLPDTLTDKTRAAQIKAFQSAYEAQTNEPISFVVQGTYDAFQLIVNALKAGGGDKTKILAYLNGLNSFQGLNWKLSYSSDNHRGSDTDNYVMMKYDAAAGSWGLASAS